MPLTHLIDKYCASWSTENAGKRRVSLLSILSDGATYTDPTVHAVGAEELLAHIAGIQSEYPGACILRTSNVDVHHGVARFAWKFVMPDGSSLPEGLDIAFLDEEQKRITRIIGFFGLLKPARSLAEGGVS
ncbi:nuclear transport factor 2 family protein [Mesorhizobium sp. M7A.F.Ca.MR.362.00.0.0]|uniref:nuclear transport factor 2 family protein n=1 Tax=Mesorhizobium sp. M7A.F.Ca.MR.362.00.0.0 TaxID=2496779 RepID=UPI000FD46569|nr:nuclear transport factor 2 family protein [Mesorhizobium sp. M7A.F.Ca.MR.362.00.0.0]RUU76500.1 nuclear transport factor 2 family protein [Mesorhizobium sp. M7A.F.Ca.MR.362.00.0.0]RWN92463.1 MAG: nuclear transport factor 2 family protein [Mesorhizobium sp.]